MRSTNGGEHPSQRIFSLTGTTHRYGDATVLRVDEWHAWTGEHWLLAAATIGTWLPAAGELANRARAWQAEEWGVVALALAAGIIATLIPAWRAYRQDVAATPAEG